jgi:hypothetical protein
LGYYTISPDGESNSENTTTRAFDLKVPDCEVRIDGGAVDIALERQGDLEHDGVSGRHPSGRDILSIGLRSSPISI